MNAYDLFLPLLGETFDDIVLGFLLGTALIFVSRTLPGRIIQAQLRRRVFPRRANPFFRPTSQHHG